MKCECKIKYYPTDLNQEKDEIVFCPLHAVAPELLEALILAEQLIANIGMPGGWPYSRQMNWQAVVDKANGAIKKAEGKTK